LGIFECILLRKKRLSATIIPSKEKKEQHEIEQEIKQLEQEHKQQHITNIYNPQFTNIMTL
jgi:predicted AlkP superfamily phosphohydrolase/phosphomutase